MDEQRRISVRRGRQLVPLLGGASRSEQPSRDVLLERHAVRPGEIPEHEHPELCLHLQEAGEDDFEWWSGGRNAVTPTRAGSLILIPPGTRDRLRWTGPSQRTIVSIATDALTDLAEEFGSSAKPEFALSWSLNDPALRGILLHMSADARDGWPLGALYSDLLAMGLKKHLLRARSLQPVVLPALTGGLSLAALRRAMEYLNEHLAEDVHLPDVAAAAEMSASHFAHQFRNSTGQTPYQYLLDQRMARAKALLRSTSLSVQYVGAAVGYPSAVNFGRAFRQRFGVTPLAWRRNG